MPIRIRIDDNKKRGTKSPDIKVPEQNSPPTIEETETQTQTGSSKIEEVTSPYTSQIEPETDSTTSQEESGGNGSRVFLIIMAILIIGAIAYIAKSLILDTSSKSTPPAKIATTPEREPTTKIPPNQIPPASEPSPNISKKSPPKETHSKPIKKATPTESIPKPKKADTPPPSKKTKPKSPTASDDEVVPVIPAVPHKQKPKPKRVDDDKVVPVVPAVPNKSKLNPRDGTISPYINKHLPPSKPIPLGVDDI